MHTIVTISRQYGSRGLEIGRRLAEELGIPCYDKQSLRQQVLESDFDQTLATALGDRSATTLLYTLATGSYSFGYHATGAGEQPIGQKPYLLAFETIKQVAKKGPCVIVGRCADYVLEGKFDTLSTFVHAPELTRIETVGELQGLDTRQSLEKVREMDRLRGSYYNYYSDRRWGDVGSYDLAIDSSRFGVDGAVALIKAALADEALPSDTAFPPYRAAR